MVSSPQAGHKIRPYAHSVEHSEQIRNRFAPSPSGRSTPTCGFPRQNGQCAVVPCKGACALWSARFSAYGCRKSQASRDSAFANAGWKSDAFSQALISKSRHRPACWEFRSLADRAMGWDRSASRLERNWQNFSINRSTSSWQPSKLDALLAWLCVRACSTHR